MVKLSGFADEISPELDVQLDTLDALGIKFLELRGVWGKNVLALSDEELETIKAALRRRGIGVSAIGSPVGKAPIDNDWEEYKQVVQRAIDVAVRMECPYIRIFSFYCRDRAADRDEVMRRMQAMVDMAEAHGVVMLHENEKGIYGETAVQCADLHRTITGKAFRATFDPANYVQAGVKPFDEAWPLLKPYVEYFHIKDAVMADGHVVPAGEGDGQLRELMAAAKAMGYRGFLSLEPHLQIAGHSSGFTGPELFATAVNALRKILDELNITYQ